MFQVFSDFDGTITQGDTIDFLLEHLAHPAWKDVEAEWETGAIGSRECLSRQIPLIEGGWPAVKELLNDVKVDPTFKEFASWAKANSIPLFIVSEGLDRVIEYLLKRENIYVDAIWANHLEEADNGALSLSFPNPPMNLDCRAGLCKCRILENISTGPQNVVIGDGQSDLCWAGQATILFAKSKLRDYCLKQHIPFHSFDSFDTIRNTLEGLRQPVVLHPPLAAVV